MKRFLLVAASLALSGCATKPDWHWSKQGSSRQDFDMDAGQCRAQAFSVASGNMMQIALVFDGCMHGKGWQKVASQ